MERLPFDFHGWFMLATSRELARKQMLGCTLAGRELVLFRTESGRVLAVDNSCPHLGAPFAPAGDVVGETIRCNYHGFRFDADGRCVATGYGTKAPPTACVPTWPVVERGEMIFVWHDALRRAPLYDAPQLDLTGWSQRREHHWSLRAHPQDIAENAVDLGHFSYNHKYRNVTLERFEVDGHLLRATYSFERDSPYGPGTLVARIAIRLEGLGFYVVEGRSGTNLDSGIESRMCFACNPVRDGEIAVRVFSELRPLENGAQVHPLMRRVPTRVLDRLVLELAHRTLVHDFAQDFPFVQGKRFIERPPIAVGDGPIPKFRQWTTQFYRNEGRVALAVAT